MAEASGSQPVAAVGTNALGIDVDVLTRGGAAEDRGNSMVEKHKQRLQMEKENQAMNHLALVVPEMGAAVRALALREAKFDVEEAARMLNQFSSDCDQDLKPLQKQRKKAIDDEARDAVKAEASSGSSGSDSEASSSSDDSSGSDTDGDDKRKGKRGSKDRKSSKSKSKKGSKDKERSKSKKGKRRKDKDKGKDKKKDKKTKDTGSTYGKYGIIREIDYNTKRSEFILWAMEVKKVDVEMLPKPDERELFKDFMEDFNTGTMPKKKYYNLEIYEKRRQAKAAAKGLDPSKLGKRSGGALSLNDEEEVRRQRAKALAEEREARMMEAYQELKYSDKAKDMKEQEMLRMQMQIAYKTGDKERAQKIMELLATDEDREKMKQRKAVG